MSETPESETPASSREPVTISPQQSAPSSSHLPPVAPKKFGYRVRDIHGEHFDDPWDWLRDKDDAEVLAHLEAENAWTDHICAPQRPLARRLVNEMRAHTVLTDASLPVRDGDYWWFSRWTEGQQYRTHHRVPVGDSTAAMPIPEPGVALPGEELVLDENAVAAGQEYFRLGELCPSPDGRMVAWAGDFSGDERWTWTVQDASTGRIVDQAATGTGVGLAWAADSSAFMYSRVNDSWRQDQLWLHRLGTAAHEDTLLMTEDDERFDLWFSVCADRDHVAVHATSPTTSQAWLWLPREPEAAPRAVTGRESGVLAFVEPASDHLLLIHNRDNAEGTLAVAPLPPADCALVPNEATPTKWVTIRDAGPGERLLEVEARKDFMVVSLRSGSLTQLEFYLREHAGFALDVAQIWGLGHRVDVESPVRTISLCAGGRFEDQTFRIHHNSVTIPPTWEEVDPRTGARSVLKTQTVPHWEPEDFVEERVWVLSRDGATRIPVTLVRHKDAQPDGTNAGWLHGYGAYEVCFDADFDVMRLPALNMRVVHAIAHVRGGGELGRAWYDDGKELAKTNTFADFVDVADWLVDSGWVAPTRLIAEGRSAGGLLMGAVTNMAPHRFAAVLAGVPFVDALTTILDASLPLTAGEWEEWGNPVRDPQVYSLMRSYTPYENLRDGVAYPAVMATTSLNDTRVFHVEPAKWVQRLREATASDPLECPVVLRTEMVAGHGGASGRERHWEARAEEFAFALTQVGLGGNDMAEARPRSGENDAMPRRERLNQSAE